jgi:HlyD family secretion protein
MRKFLVVGALFSAFIFFLFLRLRPSGLEVKKFTVQRTDIVKTISASGKVNAEEKVDLHFLASGTLTWLGVKEGDQVVAWQAIAQQDTRELQKTLEKYLRDYAKERNDWEEDRLVTYKNQVLTDTIKRVLEKNNWDLDKAILDVELKDIALKNATLITPIAGLVTHLDTPISGVSVSPTTTFTIVNPETVFFEANVDEADIEDLALNQSINVSLDAYPQEQFVSQLERIDFSPVITSSGGTAYQIKIPLPKNDKQKFRLGMNGDAEIIAEKRENVLSVPTEAIFESDNQRFVWIIKEGKAFKREIKTGFSTDDLTEVSENLNENDIIIRSPVTKITEGMKVR